MLHTVYFTERAKINGMQSSSRQPIVVGNWKMNPVARRKAVDLFLACREATRNISGVDIAIAAPFPYLAPIADARGRARKPMLAGQDAFAEPSGSYTGEVSAAQLAELGASHVILGHSERRERGETDEEVAAKVSAVLAYNVTAVVCVGEADRDEDGAYLGHLRDQIRSSLAGVGGKYFPRIVIAYEPIWAIGGEQAMQASEIHEMVVLIRRELTELYGEAAAQGARVIYGGSVDEDNIEEIMRDGAVDGVLPGRASRSPASFGAICDAVSRKQ